MNGGFGQLHIFVEYAAHTSFHQSDAISKSLKVETTRVPCLLIDITQGYVWRKPSIQTEIIASYV